MRITLCGHFTYERDALPPPLSSSLSPPRPQDATLLLVLVGGVTELDGVPGRTGRAQDSGRLFLQGANPKSTAVSISY